MLQICENIRQARLSRSKTQEDMAKALGVKRTTYANWEKNTEPELTIIKSIASFLDTPLHKLIDTAEDFSEKGISHPPDAAINDTAKSLVNLSDANKEGAIANRILAENQKELIEIIKGRVIGSDLPKRKLVVKRIFDEVLHELIQVGIEDGRWKSEGEALNKLDSVIPGITEKTS